MAANIKKSGKEALEAYKRKLLQEIQACEKKIEDVRRPANDSIFFMAEDGDFESSFPLNLKNMDLPVNELKQQESMLKTCLQATAELTNLEILQSAANILVEDPVIEGELPVTGEGVWREVMAECSIGHIQFSITFHAHRGEQTFAPISYRNLRVAIAKEDQEKELDDSLLPGMRRPSDAIEVIRNYSTAYRSRRSILTRLNKKFPNMLTFSNLPEGGISIKCPDLFEIEWKLQNKRSPVENFRHRYEFNLEYMEERFIKIIKELNCQLSDPEIDTEERLSLLTDIINICIEAKRSLNELQNSVSSDPEAVQNLEKIRTILDQEPGTSATNKKANDVNKRANDVNKQANDRNKKTNSVNSKEPDVNKKANDDKKVPEVNKKRSEGKDKTPGGKEKAPDSEIMAPPKSLPKRKAKGKENVDENRNSIKRSHESDNVPFNNAKRTKVGDNDGVKDKNNAVENRISASEKEVTATDITKTASASNDKGNSQNVAPINKKTGKSKIAIKTKTLQTVQKASSNGAKNNIVKDTEKQTNNVKTVDKNVSDKPTVSKPVVKAKSAIARSVNTAKNVGSVKNVTSLKNNGAGPSNASENPGSSKMVASSRSNSSIDIIGGFKNVGNAKPNSAKNVASKNINANPKVVKKIPGKVIKKPANSAGKVLEKNTEKVERAANNANNNNADPNKQKSMKNVNKPIAGTSTQVSTKNIARKPENSTKSVEKVNNNNVLKKTVANSKIKPYVANSTKKPTVASKVSNSGNSEKNNSGERGSHIPVMKAAGSGLVKKVPLRISPRKLAAKGPNNQKMA